MVNKIENKKFQTLKFINSKVRNFLNDTRDTKNMTYQEKIDYWHKTKPTLEEFEEDLIVNQKTRNKIYPYLLSIIKFLKIIEGGKNVVLNRYPEAFEDAVIICPTHDESIDYERITAATNLHTIFFHNQPEVLYGNVNDLFLNLNAHICIDTFSKEARHLGLAKMITALKLDNSVCNYPEGVLNFHPSVIVNHPYLGAIIAAFGAEKKIVPWGYESFGKQAWHKQGESFDVTNYIEKLKAKYQELIINNYVEEKSDEHETDLINYFANKKMEAQKLGLEFSCELKAFDFYIIAAYKLRDILATLKWEIWTEKQRRDLFKRNRGIDGIWHQFSEDKKSMLISESREKIPADYWQKVVEARVKLYPYEDEILTEALVNRPYDREDDVFSKYEIEGLKLGLDSLLSQINLKQNLLKLDDEILEKDYAEAILAITDHNKKPVFKTARDNLLRLSQPEAKKVISLVKKRN